MQLLHQVQLPRLERTTLCPDGVSVLAVGFPGVYRYDLTTGQQTCLYHDSGQKYTCWEAAVSADERFVVAGLGDLALRVWDYATGRHIRKLAGHQGIVTSTAMAERSRALTGAPDQTMRLWDCETGEQLQCLEADKALTWTVAISGDGNVGISCGAARSNEAVVWDLAAGLERGRLSGHTKRLNAVALSRDGSQALTGSSDSTVKLWDTASGMELQTLDGHRKGVKCVAWSPDGKRAASGSGDRTALVWDLATGEVLDQCRVSGSLGRLGFSGAQRLMTATETGDICLWQL